MEEQIKQVTFKQKFKKLMLGMNFYDGLVYKVVIYTLLIAFSYVYLYPLLFMTVNSVMGVDDLRNSGVKWVPRDFTWDNFFKGVQVLNIYSPDRGWHFTSIFDSTFYVLKVSIAATVSSALIGYGFARYNFPLKKVLFVFMLITFILPSQVTMVSTFGIYRNLGLIGSEWAMIIPAIFGQGLNQAIFILIFYQFFKTLPTVLYESAEVDGASNFKVFRSIALPLAVPSIVIVFLFSFVWYWNETFLTSLLVGDARTLPLLLKQFRSSYTDLFPPDSGPAITNEAAIMAGNMITILPLLILYFFAQKQFVESIDRTGITGE